MTTVTLDTGYGTRLIPLEEYVSEEISTLEYRGALEEQQARLECFAGRLGRLVQVLYDAGVIGVADIRRIVREEFRGSISIEEG